MVVRLSSGLTEREGRELAEWNAIHAILSRFPPGSAIRQQLERRLASLEISLGL